MNNLQKVDSINKNQSINMIYKNIEIKNFKMAYRTCMCIPRWKQYNNSYIKINKLNNENKQLIEIKNNKIIYKVYANISYNKNTTSNRLNIVLTNMKNNEIICDDKNIQNRFNDKIHSPDEILTIKLKLNPNSIFINNKNINLTDFYHITTNTNNNRKIQL